MAVLGIVGTILLTLLKVVLILLLLVLVIVLLVLFIPVRYGVWLEKEEDFFVQARVSWLCHLVSFRVLYRKGKPELVFRVFGFNLLAWLQKRQERADRDVEAEVESVQNDAAEDSEEADISMAEVLLPEHEDDSEYRGDSEEERTVPSQQPRCKHNVRRIWREILRRLRAIVDFFKGLRKIVYKLQKRAEWLGEVKDFWRSENTRQMVCIFRDNVLHLWRKLKPRTVKGQVWFGTGEPCSTGQILGVCAMLFACYGNGVAVTPDFERQIFEGKLMLKGRLSLITAVVILVRVFFSRQWKTFRREWNVIGGSFNG